MVLHCLIKHQHRLFSPSNYFAERESGRGGKSSKYGNTNLGMTELLTLYACCRQIREPCLPSGAHKSLRGMNETDIKETNCGVMCTNKTPLTFSYGTPQFLG